MKKINKIILVLVILGINVIYINSTKLTASASSILDSKETFNTYLDISKGIIISSNEIIYERSNHIYYQNEILSKCIGEGNLKNAVKKDDLIYILTSNKLYLYTISTENINTYSSNNSTYNDFIVEEDIYIIGYTNDEERDAVILKLDTNLTLINEKHYGGTANESFEKILYYNNDIYITCYKDAVSNDSLFYNVGLLGDKKAILLKVNKSLNVDNIIYFDEETNDERITSLVINGNNITVLLNTTDNNYIYDISSDFTIMGKMKLIYSEGLINNYKHNSEYLCMNNNTLNVVTNTISNIYTTLGNIIDYKVLNSKFYILKNDNGKCIIEEITEYDITGNSTIELSYLNYDKELTPSIESYFGNLTLTEIETDPYFDANQNGQYLRSYLINELNISINQLIKIKSFTNFTNGGIYEVGKVLKFFGKCYLNNELVVYGTILDTPGEYDLIIKDVNNNCNSYHITIIESYYHSLNDVLYLEDEITYHYNEIPSTSIKIDNLSTVNEIIVDDGVFNDYEVNNNILTLFFDVEDTTTSHIIKNILYTNTLGEQIKLNIDKEVIFKQIKTDPILSESSTINKDYFEVLLDITDPDQTFSYLYITNNNDYKVITTDSTFKLSTKDQVDLYYCYDDNHQIKRVLLGSVKFDDNNYEFNFTFNYLDGSIKGIQIDAVVPDDYSLIKSINFVSKDYTDYYKSLKEFDIVSLVLKVTVGIVIFGSMAVVVLIIFKKNKRQKYI